MLLELTAGATNLATSLATSLGGFRCVFLAAKNFREEVLDCKTKDDDQYNTESDCLCVHVFLLVFH